MKPILGKKSSFFHGRPIALRGNETRRRGRCGEKRGGFMGATGRMERGWRLVDTGTTSRHRAGERIVNVPRRPPRLAPRGSVQVMAQDGGPRDLVPGAGRVAPADLLTTRRPGRGHPLRGGDGAEDAAEVRMNIDEQRATDALLQNWV